MPLFNVVFEVAGFADDADIDGREMTEQEMFGFTAQSRSENLFPANVQAIAKAYMCVDDAQGDSDIRCFANITLVVSADSARAAEKMVMPLGLLTQLVDFMTSMEPSVTFTIDGDWSLDEVTEEISTSVS